MHQCLNLFYFWKNTLHAECFSKMKWDTGASCWIYYRNSCCYFLHSAISYGTLFDLSLWIPFEVSSLRFDFSWWALFPFHDEINLKVKTDQFMGYLGTKMNGEGGGDLMLLPILSHELGFGKLWQINRNGLVSWAYAMKKFPHCSSSWVTIVNHWTTTTLTNQSPTFCPQRALILISKALFLTRNSDYSHIMHEMNGF